MTGKHPARELDERVDREPDERLDSGSSELDERLDSGSSELDERLDSAPAMRHFTATAYVVAGGRTLLLWHRKLGMWLPPGGHCEPDEDPVQAACREAEEESGLAVRIIPPPGLLHLMEPGAPLVLPPPEVILIEEIRQAGQPFHHHIDHVYFTRPVTEPVDFAAAIPAGEHRWVTAAEMAATFALTAPDGTVVPVAEDVRLLAIRAIAAAAAEDSPC